ncbi:MAG: hypothetical protein N3G76_00850 [Candidatus Micrarchaeota archaeon]|nr:hypothetical protein [Candidatus Micrarchaeota archaeon]
MATFLVLGNIMHKEDGTAVRIMPLLEKEFPMHEFLVFDPNESIPSGCEKLLIIDVVKGITKVEVLTEKDIHRLRDFPKVGMHDFDLAFQLKMLTNIGIIKEIHIIGIPYGMDDNAALEQAITAIRALQP